MIKMTLKEARQYKQKWTAVQAIEKKELRNLPFLKKFQQTASLIRLGLTLNMDFHEDSKIQTVRRRWTLLKKNMK